MRAFLAVPLSDEGEESVRGLQASLRTLPALAEFRWIAPANIHLTLRFLGEVDEDRARAAGDALEAAVAEGGAFELWLERFGVFPHLKRPNVLWAGPNETPPPVAALAEALSAGLDEAGFPPEDRPFRPHLTLGRRRARGRPPAGLEGELEAAERRWLAPSPVLRMGEAVLFKSELRPGGAIYTALRRFPLPA